MNFKLLAIRPLAKCNSNFLKVLKENFIYRFYNEYDFIYNLNERELSLTDFQQNFFREAYARDQEIPYLNIEKILFKKEVVTNLYGKNIDISAIVGKNGSGKSSLLELVYAFVFNISKKSSLIKTSGESISYNKINVELYYMDNESYFKIVHKYNGKNSISIEVFEMIDGVFKPFKNSKNVLYRFYFLVINYSLYGLNSNVSGAWVKKLFHKNDGYQSPIVINPFRDEGNIDVNNEYNLSQARLILHKYFVNKSDLISGITLEKINFIVDIEAKQTFSPRGKSKIKKLIIEDVFSFLKSNRFNGGEKFSEMLNVIFRIKNDESSDYLKNLNSYLYALKERKRYKLTRLTNNYSDELTYLCFLYIFKKLNRVAENYVEYNKYVFLFQYTLSEKLLDKDVQNFKSDFKKRFKLKDLNDLISKSDNIIKIEQFISRYLTNIESIANLYGNKISSEFKGAKISDQFDSSGKLSIDETIDLIFEKYLEIINKNRKLIFNDYINDLYSNDTHIAFKFKQSINYIKNGLFKDVEIEQVVDVNNKIIPKVYNVKIREKFIDYRDIDNVPISFFDPEILVNKNGKEYTFNSLSSGEQQLIHSILNITYHLFNLDSVKKNTKNKKVYRNINLIFDEVELYFHPEFQRNFIHDLLNNINGFSDLKFNIIFSTHSPFILSDIPSQNILRLDDGISITEKNNFNSFGANIHDLLADEFFLEGNTIGAFANSKIDQIIKFLFLKNKIWELNENIHNTIFSEALRKHMKEEIIIMESELSQLDSSFSKNQILEINELIGEPLLKNKIAEMVEVVFKKTN